MIKLLTKKTKAICVIGFSFSETDAHVNGIIRNIIKNEDKILIIVTSVKDMNEEYYDRLKSRLRLNDSPNVNVYVLGVGANKNSEKLHSFKNNIIEEDFVGIPWYDTINSLLNKQSLVQTSV